MHAVGCRSGREMAKEVFVGDGQKPTLASSFYGAVARVVSLHIRQRCRGVAVPREGRGTLRGTIVRAGRRSRTNHARLVCCGGASRHLRRRGTSVGRYPAFER